MTAIAIARHLVCHWFFLEPILSGSVTMEEYYNGTYYVRNPKGTEIVRCPCFVIYDAMLNSRQIVQTQMTSWATSPSTLYRRGWEI